MKQLLVCYKKDRKLRVRCNILTDVFVPVQDVISPQKTTFVVPKNDVIQLSDIVIIKDNYSGEVEYIGYIDTLANKVNTEMSCYPLINVFDNDFVLDQMFRTVKKGSYNTSGQWVESETETEDVDVDAVEWLATQINRAFVYDDDKNSLSYNADNFDDLQALPLVLNTNVKTTVLYKKAIETSNLFEAYIDLFINTGVYVVFTDLVYNYNNIDKAIEIVGIKCEIRCNKDDPVYRIYEHDPHIQKVDIVDNTFTNYNKIIATEEIPVDENGNPITDREPQRFYFYLLDTNDITTDASHPNRIKQVRSKAISFNLASGESEENELKKSILIDRGKTEEEADQLVEEGYTDAEIENAIAESRAKALILTIYNELQAPEYDLKIEIDMLNNDDLFLYRRVDFVAESGIIYTSNITKIERLNDLQVRITLGALRNSLTDFKKKVEVI